MLLLHAISTLLNYDNTLFAVIEHNILQLSVNCLDFAASFVKY